MAGVTSIRQGAVYPAMAVPMQPRLVDDYLASIEAGANAIVEAVAKHIRRDCAGDANVHLVGYSQGAWSVRIATRELARKLGDPCCHGMPFIGSITLFGDPSYDSKEEIVRWGHKPRWGRDFGVAHATRLTKQVPEWWFSPYSWMVRDRVSSYCLKDDLVCRAPGRWRDLGIKALALKWTTHLDGHLSYGGDEIPVAGDWAAKWFPPPTRDVRDFAQEALDHAQAGDESWLWSFWADESYGEWPAEMVKDLAGQSGRVDHCTAIYRRCRVWLSAHPGEKWSLDVSNDFGQGPFTLAGLERVGG